MLSIVFNTIFFVLFLQVFFVNSQCTSDNQLRCYASENPLDPRRNNFATTAAGRVFPSLVAAKTVGKWGSTLLEDVYLIEKLQHANRERIPVRIGHPKGAGAFGYFEGTNPEISRYTKAAFLQKGKRTRVAVRFSTQVGEIGSADTAIDMKGFAVKCYTEEGIHDFVFLNNVVFGHRDPMILPDLLHARMKNPQTHLQDPNAFWDVASLRPETFLFILIFYSRVSFVKSYTFMDGFGIHTFKLVNKRNEPTLVKFTFTSDAKNKSYFTIPEALTTAGFSPEYLTKDLYDKIANKTYPSWTLNIQVMTPKQARDFQYNPFDSTKYWNTTQFPLIPIGKLVLDRNPTNYFNDVEQSAYCPTRMVPGIEATPDRLLIARMFAYRDAQIYRLGINHDQLPINKCPYGTRNYHRDGFMHIDSNGGNSPNYFPNSFNGPTDNDDTYYNELRYEQCGTVDRIDLKDEENYLQCREYVDSLSEADLDILTGNLALALGDVYPRILDQVFDNLMTKISKKFEYKLRKALKQNSS